MASRSSFQAARSLVSSSSRRSLHSSAPRFEQAAAPSTSASATSEPASASSSSSSTKLLSSLILSRPPTILRKPSKFEQAYFNYNRQLSEALQQPFPKDFYFKKGSAAEKRYDQDLASNPFGFKDQAQDKGKAAAEAPTSETDSDLKPLPRETEADLKNDLQSLERKLDRTLYLLVKDKAAWSFPKKVLDRQAKESLHIAAPDAVKSSLGSNMDIWLVSNSPIGLYRSGSAEKTYFLKGHIVAGKPELAKSGEVEEFRWVTKEEAQELIKGGEYWQTVEDLLDP